MKLQTRVFELSNGRYGNLSELGRAMGISVSQACRVRYGERHINEKFILGAIKAFSGYKLDDLFYIQETGLTRTRHRKRRHYHKDITVAQVLELYHQGLLVKDIVQILGCNIRTIRKRLRLGGISESECRSRCRTLVLARR